MALFKGVSTLQDYEECLKKGLCEEHSKEISQNELADLKNDFPVKAFKYIRINILCPLLFKKPPKLNKIKILMEKTPSLSKILQGGNVYEATNTLLILDSVIIFTLCQLSQICCIGALFHVKKKNSGDSKLKSLRALLLVDHLDPSIMHYLIPVLQKNFAGFDSDIIRVSHFLTLFFVRNFCTRFNMKTAIENIEKDFMGDVGWENLKIVADNFFKEEKFEDAARAYNSGLFQNAYCPDMYIQLARCYFKLKNFKACQLYSYFAIGVRPTFIEAYIQYTAALVVQQKYQEVIQIVNYALSVCDESEPAYTHLKKILEIEMSNRKELAKKSKNSNGLDGLTENKARENEKKSVRQGKAKSKCLGATKKKRTLSEGMAETLVEEEMDATKINAFLKEASEALLADCGYKAVQIFRGPLRDFVESSKFQSFEECDIVCIKYSYAIAYCKSGGHEDLQKCIIILKNILKDHDSISFPAVHYSLGLAYWKLNRFKDSLTYLEIVQNFLNKGIHFKIYPWPGMTTVIQETKPDVLKILVQDLIKECENPPSPDAYCRLANCEYRPAIYYTDPDFKGYISLSCSEQCCLHYHFLCWKAMKTEMNLTDKEFLEKSCFTPDCDGIIVKIQNIDKKGDLGKEFISDFRKNSKKWAKWEKKPEMKERKRKKCYTRSEEISILSERRNSNADVESPTLQISDSVEEINVPERSPCKVPKTIEYDAYLVATNSNSSKKSSPEIEKECDIAIASCTANNDAKVSNAEQVQENDGSSKCLNDCIKNNVYTYMEEFLQRNGPLKVDDPILIDILTQFPGEANVIIADYGGIGEFLKEDLRFAYVKDLYVCVISDVAAAYKMCSSTCLPTDFKSLQSLENSDDSKYYSIKCSHSKVKVMNAPLNPDAVEYMPYSGNMKNKYKFASNYLISQNSNSSNSIPENFKSSNCASDIHHTSNIHLNEFTKTEEDISQLEKDISSIDKNKQNAPVFVFGASIHSDKRESCDNLETNNVSDSACQSKLPSKSQNLDSEVRIGLSNKNVVHKDCTNSQFGNFNIDHELLLLLKQYYSKEMESQRPNIDSYIKPFVITKLPESTVSENVTNSPNSDSVSTTGFFNENVADRGSVTRFLSAAFKSFDFKNQLLFMLTVCFSIKGESDVKKINLYIQPFVVTKLPQSAAPVALTHIDSSSSSTLMELNSPLIDSKLWEQILLLESQLGFATELSKHIDSKGDQFQKNSKDMKSSSPSMEESSSSAMDYTDKLLERISFLENKLELASQVQDQLNAKVTQYQKCLKEKEDEKQEYEKRAQDMENGRKYLWESLSSAHKTIDNQKNDLTLLKNEKKSLLERVNDLTHSLKTNEVTMKNALDAQEKQFNVSILNLQNEKEEFKTRAKQAELQVLYLKKTEYLKKIEEKSNEASKRQKELTDGLSIVSCSLNPVVQDSVKVLATQLITYVNNLSTIKVNFVKEIDEDIEKVKNGTPLKEIKELELKELPEFPCFKNSFPGNGPAIDKQVFNSIPLLSNFGVPTQVPPVAFSPFMSDSAAIPTPKVSTTKVVLAPQVIAPLPVTSINPSNVINALSSKKNNTTDLSNGSMDFTVNSQIEESFKSAMASINSYASTPFVVQSPLDEFKKKCVIFKHQDPVQTCNSKLPPGIQKPTIPSTATKNPVPEPKVEAACSSAIKHLDSLDTITVTKPESNQSNWDQEKKKTTTANKSYEKLLNKLKDQFPHYTQDQLINYVKEVRDQREGKLSGMTIDNIVSEIRNLMVTKNIAKKKITEAKVLPKTSKVLVNKKLVPDLKPVVTTEQPVLKKKSAWGNINSDSEKKFSGSIDDDCTICCDPMTSLTAYKVNCGHTFHENCIRQWLNTKSDCPVCRVLLLLPDEYPDLS